MAINDNLWIRHGNFKRFPFELTDDYGKIIHNLNDASAIDFVLMDLEKNVALRLTTPESIVIDRSLDEENMKGWVTVTINTADSEGLSVGMYRYAIQARWPDGRTLEWTYPNVLHVLAGIID